jgi:nucleoside-diphosphate-sugar epimerase
MKVFITGGGGFLGFAIVQQLVKEGYEVVSYSRSRYEKLEKPGITHYQGDLNDYAALISAMQGCSAVFHVAAKAGYWGTYESFYKANVAGTENILKCCKELGISRLVYTSSASVVFQDNSEGRNESLPYPSKYYSFYPETKAIAERAVLAANSPGLITCSLRPHLVWGPGDQTIFPRLCKKRRNGILRLVGTRQYLIDTIYIENAARAHLLAFKAMLNKPASVAGKAYFISQNEPIAIRAFIDKLLAAAGLDPVDKTINLRTALIAGWLFQSFYRLFNIQSEPPFTVFIVKQFSSSHWYDISAAIADFDYNPVVSIDEGMKQMKIWNEKNSAVIA